MRDRNYSSESYEEDSGNRRNFRGRDGGDRFGGGSSMTPPVKEGEELDVTIEAIAAKGDGLAKKQGFVIFVPGTKEGQNVRIRITRVLRRLAFGEVVGTASAAPAEEKKKDSENFGEEPKSEESEEKEEPAQSEESENLEAEDSENF